MKTLPDLLKWCLMVLGWRYIFISLIAFTSGCERKPHMDSMNDVPNLPIDTVYVTKVVDRCQYKYLSTDPKKAKKQLENIVSQLDRMIMEYDAIIIEKRRALRIRAAVINHS